MYKECTKQRVHGHPRTGPPPPPPGPGGPAPLLFLDETEARMAEKKKLFGDQSPLLSQGLDVILFSLH